MVQGRHRAMYRKGPEHRWAQRRAEIVQKLIAPGRVLERLVSEIRPVGVNTYFIPAGAALLLRAKATLDEFRPLANDTEGEVFE
jgi:hypothetical protein